MIAQRIKIESYHSNSKRFRGSSSSNVRRDQISKSADFTQPCSCPKVLCCDDDEFQHFAVKKLLEALQIIDLKQVFFAFSGEELLEKYQTLRAECPCNGPELVISDYYMGQNKLNGVNLIKKLREIDFKGHTILRTSNSVQTLTDIHMDFDSCLRRELINYHLGKNNLKSQKDVFRQFLTKSPN